MTGFKSRDIGQHLGMWLLIAATLLSCSTESAFGQSNDTGIREQAAVFDVVRLNADGIRRGDVMARVSYVLDAVKVDADPVASGVLVERISDYRILFDIDRGLYACYVRLSAYQIEMNPDIPAESAERRSLQLAGFCWDKDKDLFVALRPRTGIFRESPQKVMRKDQYPEESYEIDPRAFGMYPFGGQYGFAKQDEFLRLRAAGIGLLSFDRLADGAERIRFESYSDPENDSTGRCTVTFDPESHLPVHWYGECLARVAGRQRPIEAFEFEERTTWEQRGGLFLPVRCTQVVPDGASDTKGQDHHARSETTTLFHWLSVNEELMPAAFDGSVLESEASLEEWISAERAGVDWNALGTDQRDPEPVRD